MAEDTSKPSVDDREQRRGSLARRAVARVRAVIDRRRRNAEAATTRPTASSSSQEARNVSAVRTAEPATLTTAGAERNDIPHDIIEDGEPIRVVEAPVVPVATRNTIEVDANSDDEDSSEEPLLPMRMGRSGLSTEKAQALFAQHGFMYEPRGFRPQEPPNKIRRVEKAIRLRVHYTCHECHRQFGVERTCLGCGHHRCRDCSRDPPRRIRELSDHSRRSMQAEHEEERINSAGPFRSSMEMPKTAPEAASSRPAPEMLTGPLELDESAEYTTEALPQDPELSFYVQPRSGIQTAWSASSRPRVRKNPHNASHPSRDDEVPMVQAVKRVYRKPRQRVRYTCENCSTLFIEGDRCRQCGHERCQDCHREPPKRTPVQHDPDVVQAVAARLAAYDHGVTAAA